MGDSSIRNGQSLSARFHPDGRSLVVSAEAENGHDLFWFDLSMRTMRALTNHPADDIEPSFSPEAERVVFSSTRSGNSQLYTMASDGSDVVRISFCEGSYTTPIWSPRGDLVAFTKQYQNEFMLGVIDANGSGEERILYKGYYVDTPTWSPNGRILLFTRGDFSPGGTTHSIWSVDLSGLNLRRLPTQGAASDPAWSPLIN